MAEAGSLVFLLVVCLLIGMLVDPLGASIVFAVGGGISMLLLALGMLNPAIRNLD